MALIFIEQLSTIYFVVTEERELSDVLWLKLSKFGKVQKKLDGHWNILATLKTTRSLDRKLSTYDSDQEARSFVASNEGNLGSKLPFFPARNWDLPNPRWLPWKRFGRELVFENMMWLMWVELLFHTLIIDYNIFHALPNKTRFFFRRTAQISPEITLVMSTRGAKKNSNK